MLRHIARDPRIDLKVFYLSSFSTRAYHDPGFSVEVKWDAPLLDGYEHEFLPAAGRADRLTHWRPLVHGITSRLRGGAFDALWLHDYAHQANLRAALSARALGIPVMLRSESHLTSHARSLPKLAIKSVLLRMLFRLIDGFLAIGAANRDYYLHYGVSPARIFMMPYAVDNRFFRGGAERARATREDLRASLGFAPDRPIILYVSKLLAKKRPCDLLDAYARLSVGGQEPRPYLLFVGDGAERRALETEVRRTGWSSIRFAGFISPEQLPRYYDLCDVFVLPSEFEPWGLVVNEAMNAGKPVIVSDRVGAAADLVRNGHNGFVVPMGDIETLKRRLHSLLTNPAVCMRMGEASLDMIRGWNFDRDLDGLLHALRACAPRSGAALSGAIDPALRTT